MKEFAIAFGAYIAQNQLLGTSRPAFPEDDDIIEYGFTESTFDDDGEFSPKGFRSVSELMDEFLMASSYVSIPEQQ